MTAPAPPRALGRQLPRTRSRGGPRPGRAARGRSGFQDRRPNIAELRLYDGVSRLGALVGLPFAGVLVAVMNAADVLTIDAGTFVISAATVALLIPAAAQPRRHPAAEIAEPAGYFSSLRQGFSFLAHDRLLLGIAAMILVTNFVDQAGNAVLIPVWAHDIIHSSVALGLVGAAFALGAVAGNAATTVLAGRLPRRLTYSIGFFIAGAPRFVALAVLGAVSPVLAVTFVAGLGAGGINPILGAVSYERVPRHLQARVLGAVAASAWVAVPIGSLAGGLAVSVAGDRIALLAAAALYCLVSFPPFLFPVWQQMSAPAKPASAPAPARPSPPPLPTPEPGSSPLPDRPQTINSEPAARSGLGPVAD